MQSWIYGSTNFHKLNTTRSPTPRSRMRTFSILEAPPLAPFPPLVSSEGGPHPDLDHGGVVAPVGILYENGTTRYILFCVWLLLLNIMFVTQSVEQSCGSFSLLYSIPVCKYYTVHLSISQLMGIWVWWVLLSWTFKFVTFGEHLCAFLLGIYPWMGLLGHRTHICSALADRAKQIYKVVMSFDPPSSSIWEFWPPHILASFQYFSARQPFGSMLIEESMALNRG